MDRVGGGIEKFRIFKKDDCEADWIKVTERSFGQVYRVKLKLWRENCALKSFETILTGISLYMRMIEEASKMEKVTFKYIYGECNDPPAMVMEYMSNGSMDHLLTSHVLVWPKKFQTIHEATTGMNFLHSMNPPLLHLNLKPSSIRLDDHLHIKISVFDLIKWEVGSKKELIENLMARGNICYIPPETFTLCPEHREPSSIFSVVMWEILTQKNLIKVGNVSSGKRSGQMITIMQRCWDQDPRERPTSQVTLHLIADLFNVVRLLLTWLGSADECKELRGRMVFHVASVYGHLTIAKLLALHLAAEEGPQQGGQVDGESWCRSTPWTAGITPLYTSLPSMDTRASAGCCWATGRSLTPQLDANALGCAEGEAHQGSVDLPGKGGWTPLPLDLPPQAGNVVSKLLAAKANPNVAEDSGWTALHLECNGGLFPSVLQFITHRANVNAQNNSQATPLHLAAQNGSVLMTKALLLNGAERISKDSTGCTALYLARKCQKEEVVQLLEDS
uniref:Protein kinase domain-containing protein n=1 Tax=Oncorhynchus tshawytscha TaxID=74940 RepID=A0AAZ3P1X3_ONCTS